MNKLNKQEALAAIGKLKSNVEPDGDCLIWQGALNSQKYGFMRLPGNKFTTTHRAAWMLFYGNFIPRGAMVLHSCGNRACCNPDHLRLGTGRDNANDMMEAGTSLEGKRQTRLDLNELTIIRNLSHISNHKLAEMLGRSVDTVRRYKS